VRSYLIVDDNRDLAENLAEIIRDGGDEALVASSGAEALELLARRRFDALLTDMRMPAMDGAELVQRARQADPGVPAIVITAFSKDSGIRAAQNQAPLAVLPKPVPVPQLLHLLAVAKRNGRILIVEDDPQLAENLAEILQDHGFSVLRLAAPGEIDGLGPEAPLLAIVDWRLPGAPDGEAVRRLTERFPRLPLVVVTAHSDVLPPAGAARFFLKPFETGRLVTTIEDLHRVRADG
jgi:two-component system, response regulator PdtaR